MMKRFAAATWAALAAFFIACGPAHADFEFSDIACETTTTAGTGTIDLAGALTGGYLGFLAAGIDSGDTVPYHIKDGSQLETGIGTFTDATPDTLSRTAFLSTDGSGAELTLSGGTATVCIGPITSIYTGGVASFSLAGLSVAGQALSLSAPLTIPADPGADRFLFWDESENATAWLTPGNGLTITTTTVAVDGASTSVDGIVELASLDEAQDKASTSLAVTPSNLAQFSHGLIWGLTLSNNGTDAANDIDVAVGVASAASNPHALMTLGGALTKQIDAAWAVGTNQGCLDGTESAAGTPDISTWYHVYLIRRSDTGVEDIACSENASTPSIDATPIPVAYDQYRRIGSVYNDAGGDLAGFTQIGDEFLWDVQYQNSDTNNPGTAPVTLAVRAPLGIVTQVILAARGADLTPASRTDFLVSSLDTSAATPGSGVFTLQTDAASEYSVTQIRIMTNTSSQIRYELSQSTTDHYFTTTGVGWVDTRGRLN
jgi:hypothetical protein